MVGYVATGIIFSVLEPPKSFTGTRHARSCLIIILNIAAREYPRAGSKQMATYQTVVAQTQSSSSSSNLCCSVHTQTNLVCSSRRLLVPTHYPLCIINECCVAHTSNTAQSPNCAAATTVVHIFSHPQQLHACCTSLSPSIFPTCLFYTKNHLAKLKGLLRVQPNGRRKDEPQ